MDQQLPTDGSTPSTPAQPVQPVQPAAPAQPVTPTPDPLAQPVQQQPAAMPQQPVQPTPPIQPIQDPPPPPPPVQPLGDQPMDEMPKKSGGSRFFLYLIILLLLLGGGAIGLLFLMQSQSSDDSTTTQQSTTDTTTVEVSEITEVDETWNKYTNTAHGFSLNVPKMFTNQAGDCEQIDDSYRMKSAEMPAFIIKDDTNSLVYVTSEYFYRLTGEETTDDITTYAGCDMVNTTVTELEDQDNYQLQSWKIMVNDVVDEAALGTLISDYYGEGCELGEKKETTQSGVYSIEVGGDMATDPIDPEPGQCAINYVYVMYYNENTGKVVNWDIGQACTFIYTDEDDNAQCYDQEMVDSFLFSEAV